MIISADKLDFKELNDQLREVEGSVQIDNCYGQRFIGAGMSNIDITINGTPGNALGAYLDGGSIEVKGNAQDAVGDTMNDGTIIIHGNAGDALGYAMRGGIIFVEGSTGYRTGIHMKEYQEKKPAIVIGKAAGSFLGEYLAGGLIVVLGIEEDSVPVGNFTGTGMHGGRIFIRTNHDLVGLPDQVTAKTATPKDLKEIEPLLSAYSRHFNIDTKALLNDKFYMLVPNAKNPYKQLYTKH